MLVWKIRTALLVAACLLLAGCGASRSATGPAGVTLRVTERDFHIGASAQRVPAGLVDLSVRNHGPDDHELIVVREPTSTRLPMRSDGVTVDEDRLLPVTVGTPLEPGAPGSIRSLRLHLTPGRYVLFCNMAGHYLGGMRTDLLVGR
jgi:uncharacterized cupredoxin-like copper-binding protein